MITATAKGLQAYCHIRRKLADEYATNARLHAESVVLLTHSAIAIEEYERLRAAARDAQERTEVARLAFEEHLSLHQCIAADRDA